MKSVLAFAFLSVSAFAETGNFPTYFPGNVEGFLASGLTLRQAFTFAPGSLTECEKKTVGTAFVVHTCKVKGASMSVTGGVHPMNVEFDKLFVFLRTPKKGADFVREFIFDGKYTETSTKPVLSSSARLVLGGPVSSFKELRGNFEMKELDLKVGLQATPVN